MTLTVDELEALIANNFDNAFGPGKFKALL
jgi:hypothetical protein